MKFKTLCEGAQAELFEANRTGRLQFLNNLGLWNKKPANSFLYDDSVYRINPDMPVNKTFGQMNADERTELLLAHYKDKKEVEFYCEFAEEWFPINNPSWAESYQYRIAEDAVSPISFDWDALNDRYKYIAKDSGGSVYAFEHRPSYCGPLWSSNGGGMVCVDSYADLDAGTIAAEDSMITRP